MISIYFISPNKVINLTGSQNTWKTLKNESRFSKHGNITELNNFVKYHRKIKRKDFQFLSCTDVLSVTRPVLNS